MIILFIILFTALTIIGFFYMKGAASWILGVLSMMLLLISMLGLIYHDNNHWGMKQVTATATKQIYSAGDASQPYGLIVKQAFGTKSGNYIFMYKAQSADSQVTVNFFGNTKMISMTDKNAQKEMQSWISDIMKNHIVETSKKSATYTTTNGQNAELVTKTTRWEWANGFAQFLFGIGGESGDLVSEKYTVQVPKDTWLVLTTTQLEQLQNTKSAMTPAQAAESAAAQAQISQALAAAPDDAARMQIRQEAAKQEVAQIKQMLGITN